MLNFCTKKKVKILISAEDHTCLFGSMFAFYLWGWEFDYSLRNLHVLSVLFNDRRTSITKLYVRALDVLWNRLASCSGCPCGVPNVLRCSLQAPHNHVMDKCYRKWMDSNLVCGQTVLTCETPNMQTRLWRQTDCDCDQLLICIWSWDIAHTLQFTIQLDFFNVGNLVEFLTAWWNKVKSRCN